MVSLIAAVARNGVIGVDGDLPWRLPADLAHFARTTRGKTVLMGRRTYESIGGPLPGRRNLVLSRDPDFCAPGCERVDALEPLLREWADRSDECVVIGGASVYAAALPYARRLYLTQVDAEVEGDTRFPEVDWEQWRELERREHPADERHAHAFSIALFERLH